MDISIRSHHAEIGDGLRRTVEEKVKRLGRFLEGMERAEVCFREEKSHRVCDIAMYGHGHTVRAQGLAVEAHTALDRCVDTMEHNLVKLKDRLVSRSRTRSGGHHNVGV